MASIPQGFTHPIISCMLLTLECIAFSNPVMGLRAKYFTKDFLEDNFGAVATEQIGRLPSKNGYPDAGNGRYSKKLSLEQWLNFNQTMRAHLNFVEMLPVFIFFILISAFFNSSSSMYCGYGIVLSRFIHMIGYRRFPDYRALGSWGTFVCVFYLIYVSINGLIQAK